MHNLEGELLCGLGKGLATDPGHMQNSGMSGKPPQLLSEDYGIMSDYLGDAPVK